MPNYNPVHYSSRPEVSARCRDNPNLLALIIGYRLICKACRAPFRCFREHETYCGCCRK